MSLKLRFIRFCMKLGPGFDITPKTDYAKMRKMADNMQMSLVKSVKIEETKISGVDCEWLTPDRVDDEDTVIFYIHGGGFVNGSAKGSRFYGTTLADEMKRRVVTISYRLAPEHKFPAGLEDCYAVYCELIKEHRVVLVGESAGGNLVLAVTLKAKKDGIRLPESIVCMSPCTDFYEDLPSRKKNAGAVCLPQGNLVELLSDVYLTPDTDRKDPLLSPMYGDYTGFPPVFLSADDGEILFDDTDLLVPKIKAAGVEVLYEVQHDYWHAFGTTGRGCPESCAFLKTTRRFIEEHL